MSTTLRFAKILDLLQKTDESNPVKINHILSRLNGSVTDRTVQRDLKKLREEFTVPIENVKGKGYFLSSDDFWNNSQNLARFFEMEATIEALKDTFSKNKKGLVYVDLEKNDQFKGIDYINNCLEAISHGNVIRIKHLKFNGLEAKEYMLQPYMLKEYQNRWYIVGISASSKEMQTFGLDRIEELKVMKATFKRNIDLHPEDDFARIIGLNYSAKTSEKIVLQFTAHQGEYVKTLPLHASQKIISENKEKILFELNVVPNHELKQKILIYTPFVKVIEPQWLREEVLEVLKNGVEAYS